MFLKKKNKIKKEFDEIFRRISIKCKLLDIVDEVLHYLRVHDLKSIKFIDWDICETTDVNISDFEAAMMHCFEDEKRKILDEINNLKEEIKKQSLNEQNPSCWPN